MAEDFDTDMEPHTGNNDLDASDTPKRADDESRIRFSNALKHYLIKFDKTQRDIANYLNVSEPTVSQWCSGQKMPRVQRVKKLADYFGISFNDMLALPASEDFADIVEYQSGIVDEIDMLYRKIERAPKPLVYGGNELSEEVTDVLSAAVNLVRKGKSDRRKPSE